MGYEDVLLLLVVVVLPLRDNHLREVLGFTDIIWLIPQRNLSLQSAGPWQQCVIFAGDDCQAGDQVSISPGTDSI